MRPSVHSVCSTLLTKMYDTTYQVEMVNGFKNRPIKSRDTKEEARAFTSTYRTYLRCTPGTNHLCIRAERAKNLNTKKCRQTGIYRIYDPTYRGINYQ